MAAKRSYPAPKARGGGREGQPHIEGAMAAQAQEGREELSHFATLWTVARQASLSLGFSRKEYWSRLPCTPLGGNSQHVDLKLPN